jgi:phosphatidylglycerol:prolipoprotein diacylglycerol transferase
MGAAGEGKFPWYGLLIGLGMAACIAVAVVLAKKRGYYGDLVFDIAICCLPLGILGARLGYVIFDLTGNPNADWSFGKFFGFENGGFVGFRGLMIYGGLIGASLGAIIVRLLQKKRPDEQRVTFFQMADLAFAVVLLGQAIGRWGNFANQEAYGNYVGQDSWFPYAVFIDEKGGWFQATFFYESMWNLIGFSLILWTYAGRRKSFDGFTFSLYCIFYGAGRFFIESLRSDSLWLIKDLLRVSQLISVLIFVLGLMIILTHIYRARAQNKRIFILAPEDGLNAEYLDYEKSMLYRRTLAPANAPEEEADIDETPAEERYWEQDAEGYREKPLEEQYFGPEEAEKYFAALHAGEEGDDAPTENDEDTQA